jgi:beta-galactosidase GanA
LKANTIGEVSSSEVAEPLKELRMSVIFALFVLAISGGYAAGQAKSAAPPGIPHLERHGAATQLVVDGRPFLVLGGEVHNSSSSSVEYMKPVWPRLAAMHLNTVVLPVAWETIEPQDGKFDFSCVDGLLEGARQNNLRLVVLWFGAWKNTFSSYAPAWVKTNLERFPRVQTADGRGTERLSPFSTAVRDADARAFAALMRHLREVDGEKHTVLMVQVENEVGVIPQSRDHSAMADAAFVAKAPAELMSYLRAHRATLEPELRAAWEAAGEKTEGSWQDVFGKTPLTDDLFMAWQYAAYIEHIAAAGKREYALPMYANAALIRPNYEPGQYNSGGPLPHSIDVWRAAAPSLDFLSPDIYFNEFAFWAGEYARPSNPLFIPEAQGGSTGAANALYAFGRLNAIGFSPFGIDDASNKPIDLVGITTQAQGPDGSAALSGVYATLAKLAPIVLEKQQTGGVTAEMIEGEAQRSAKIAVGDYTATLVSTSHVPGARVSAMFLQRKPDEFLVVGAGDGQVVFTTDKPGPPIVGIESIDEEFFENGAWVPRRRLNGDENGQGQVLKLSAADAREGRIYRVRLYRYR